MSLALLPCKGSQAVSTFKVSHFAAEKKSCFQIGRGAQDVTVDPALHVWKDVVQRVQEAWPGQLWDLKTTNPELKTHA